MQYRITAPVVDIHEAPEKRAQRGKFETQLVYGELFTVEEEKNGWCKGVCAHDGYPGYVESKYLSKDLPPATHIVTAARTHVYEGETIKSLMKETLSFGSLINITATGQKFAQMSDGGWVYQKHITPIDQLEKDPIATAQKFLETPYYWGGRSGFGIDCSGLVQVSLARAGIAVLRDTEMQEDKIGKAVETAKAGDIVFFPQHVGIMVDDKRIIHANSFHMKVTIETLEVVAERSGGVTGIRRINCNGIL